MAALTKYEGAAQVFVNGRLLAEAQTSRLSLTANDNEVNTMQKGFAGFSDGPERAEVSIDTAVPKAGYELDFWTLCRDKSEVRVVQISGGVRRQIQGRITSFEETKGTGQTATASVTIVGRPLT